jgi:hypothetical protein
MTQLEEAFGLGGRPRSMTDTDKRERNRIVKAIERATKSICKGIPELAEVLKSVAKRNGTFCYETRSVEYWDT